jgi:Mn2+/Fe2+ NRAMP family transporter
MDTLTHDPVKQPTRPKLLQVMGPGLITGASDDDPGGIATYSQRSVRNSATALRGRSCSATR